MSKRSGNGTDNVGCQMSEHIRRGNQVNGTRDLKLRIGGGGSLASSATKEVSARLVGAIAPGGEGASERHLGN